MIDFLEKKKVVIRSDLFLKGGKGRGLKRNGREDQIKSNKMRFLEND